jgi:hypothetical protein
LPTKGVAGVSHPLVVGLGLDLMLSLKRHCERRRDIKLELEVSPDVLQWFGVDFEYRDLIVYVSSELRRHASEAERLSPQHDRTVAAPGGVDQGADAGPADHSMRLRKLAEIDSVEHDGERPERRIRQSEPSRISHAAIAEAVESATGREVHVVELTLRLGCDLGA